MYKIEVKKIDIRKGFQNDACGCAVARAFKREGFEFTEFHHGVDGRWVTADAPDGQYYCKYLPLRVQKWIAKFDADKKSVKPFSFTIR